MSGLQLLSKILGKMELDVHETDILGASGMPHPNLDLGVPKKSYSIYLSHLLGILLGKAFPARKAIPTNH